mmetsp:Transcript_82546/g.266191  ORF Transcript_82546/g.266191 Transcript_82546/m.266191 type:complete len:897 (-) Transcript_82546:547-3237(-)
MLADSAEAVLEAARGRAKDLGHQQLDALHLLLVQIDTSGGLARRAMQLVPGDLQRLRATAEEGLQKFPKIKHVSEEVQPNTGTNHILAEAQRMSQDAEKPAASAADLFVAVSRHISELFVDGSFSLAALEKAARTLESQQKETGSETAEEKLLRLYGTDLVSAAERGELDPVVGLEEEIRAVTRVLSRRTRNCPLLIGEPGVGKTSVIAGLAALVAKGEVPDGLRGARVISLNSAALVSGAEGREGIAQRLRLTLEEVTACEGRAIVFIDEMHLLLGVGKLEGSDVVGMLQLPLVREDVRCIGATTLDGHRQHFEKDRSLERCFQQVRVREPSVKATVAILQALRDRLSAHHGVNVQEAALVAAAMLTDRYMSVLFLPAKAVDAIDEACANVSIRLSLKPEELETLEQKRLELEVEAIAIGKAEKAEAWERLEEIKSELSKLDEKLQPMRSKYEFEKMLLSDVKEAKNKLMSAKVQMQLAETRRDLKRVSEAQFHTIPDLKKRIHRLEAEKAQSTPFLRDVVTVEDVADVVARWSRVPAQKLSQSERERFLSIAPTLKECVLGQDEAADAIARAVMISAAGLKSRTRPMGSFLFLGPAGTGKTKMARALALALFDTESRLVHVDLSEYADKSSFDRLLGTWGEHEQGGYLTEALRLSPHSVVLLDSLEAAHPDIFDMLMGVVTEGRLTDTQGRMVDCSNAIFIMTSDVGRAPLSVATSDDNPEVLEHAKGQCLESARSSLRSEFLNSLDDVIVFGPLSSKTLRGVVRLELQEVSKRLAELDIEMTVTDAALDHAVKQCREPGVGARPLRRWLERHVVGALSAKVVTGELLGGRCACVDFDGQRLSVEVSGFPKTTDEDQDMESAPLQLVDSKARRITSSWTPRSECAHLPPKRLRM